MQLTTTQLKVLFVILYLVVDISYVVLSRPFYEAYARKIQGSGFAVKKDTLLFAGISYVIMGVAWWYMVANRIQKDTPMKTAVLHAFILGLAIYGVFNATLYVIFKDWDYRIVLRDTLWGISWLSVLTILYKLSL